MLGEVVWPLYSLQFRVKKHIESNCQFMGAFLSILGCTKPAWEYLWPFWPFVHQQRKGHRLLKHKSNSTVLNIISTDCIIVYQQYSSYTALINILMFKLLKGLLLLMKQCNEIHIATSIQKIELVHDEQYF